MPQVPKRTGFYLYSFPYTYLHGIGVLKRFLEFDNGNGILISGIDQPIPKFREQEGEWKIEIPIFRDGNEALLFLGMGMESKIYVTEGFRKDVVLDNKKDIFCKGAIKYQL